MKDLKAGDRVVVHDGRYGSGTIESGFGGGLFLVKCDKKLPNEYAWETDTSLFFAKDLKLDLNNEQFETLDYDIK